MLIDKAVSQAVSTSVSRAVSEAMTKLYNEISDVCVNMTSLKSKFLSLSTDVTSKIVA